MIKKYNHKQIEKKWQEYWKKKKIFEIKEDTKKPKQYILDMFPYPSGAGLHVGHPKGYIATDVISRMRMMQGYNVLHPMGWDAFGLPAENYAIKNKMHPSVATAKNVKTFKKQLGLLGFTYDWSREINTTDPNYYKWTQWIFLQMFKRGLAYESNEPINWCPSCKTGLANEDLEDGKCERCGSVVEQKPLRQWVLKITDYADRLLKDIDKLDKWPEPIKEMQRNWIGRSEGINFKHKVKDLGIEFEVYDSIPQTFLAQTFVIIAPEHPLVEKLVKGTNKEKEVMDFVEKIKAKKLSKKFDIETDMEGIFTGRYSENYMGTGRDLPIWVASFALMDYGTGIVGCSAHDERDYAFAKKYNLPLHPVLFPKDRELAEKVRKQEVFYREPDGILEEPKEFAGKRWDEARTGIIEYIVKNGWGTKAVNYKLRDWVFSRQRYWGEPIPLVHCDNCADKKPKILLIHGYGGHDQENWFPWFKKEMENSGFEVLIPNLPDTDKPNFEKWLSALKKIDIDKKDKLYVIGHSLGCPTACHFIQRSGLVVEKLILVAPVGPSSDFEHLKKYDFVDDDVKIIRRFSQERLNFDKLVNLIGNSKIYLSEDDPYIPLNIKDDYKKLQPSVKVFRNKGHFNQGAGILEFPEILEEFPNARDNGWLPVPEKNLPLKLPNVKHYEPSGTGESPLANIEKWVNTKCPVCGGPAKRETNTMPQWAGSCWYYLRYCDPKNQKNLLNTGFVHKPAIEATEKDKKYFELFKQIYSDLEKAGIETWAGNRLMLNGINHDLWVPLRTVCLLLWNDDMKKATEYLMAHGYKQIQDLGGNVMFEKNEMRVEYVPVYKDKKNVYSLSYNKVKQPMEEADLSEVLIGELWRFSYRVVSPRYNLWHLKYVQKHEPEHRAGIQDQERIEFLENWMKSTNQKLLYWNPVDIYVGGAEHATRHLIYARFWHKFLYDIGAVNNDEPFTRLQNVGLILAEDGRKMSKRWGNVINPDDVVREYGADAMRLYEMFMGPFDQPCAWSMQGLVGMRRFLEKVWFLKSKVRKSVKSIKSPIDIILHQTIKKVTDDIEAMRFNTAIASLMTLVNEMSKSESLQLTTYNLLLQLLSPFAPHITEELWHQLGNKTSITKAEWPKYDPELAKSEEMTIAVQVNGKLRDTIIMLADASEETIKSEALKSEKVQKWLEGKEPKKVIYVKGKLISIVV